MPVRRLAVQLLGVQCPTIHLQLLDKLVGENLNFIQLTEVKPEVKKQKTKLLVRKKYVWVLVFFGGVEGSVLGFFSSGTPNVGS